MRTQDTKFIPYMTLFYYKDTIKQLPNLNQESFKKWKFKIESPPTVRTDKIELRKLKDGEVVANFGISTYFTNEGRSLRVQAGLTYKASRLAAYHNTWALNKLYTFQPSSELKLMLTQETGVVKTYFTMIEILEFLRYVIHKDQALDKGNPSMIISTPRLERSLGVKAFHVSEIKGLVEKHLREVPEHMYRQGQAIGWKQTCLGNLTHQNITDGESTPSTKPKPVIDPQEEFEVNKEFLQTFCADKRILSKKTATYIEIALEFSKYIMNNKNVLMDPRSPRVAKLKGTELGKFLKMKRYHRKPAA